MYLPQYPRLTRACMRWIVKAVQMGEVWTKICRWKSLMIDLNEMWGRSAVFLAISRSGRRLSTRLWFTSYGRLSISITITIAIACQCCDNPESHMGLSTGQQWAAAAPALLVLAYFLFIAVLAIPPIQRQCESHPIASLTFHPTDTFLKDPLPTQDQDMA